MSGLPGASVASLVVGSTSLALNPSSVASVHTNIASAAAVYNAPRTKNDLYKTEICRSFAENSGYCKYGSKCQFAHGENELRPVRRHPRYKTKLCRNYSATGSCPYDARCRFIHAPSDMSLSAINAADAADLPALDKHQHLHQHPNALAHQFSHSIPVGHDPSLSPVAIDIPTANVTDGSATAAAIAAAARYASGAGAAGLFVGNAVGGTAFGAGADAARFMFGDAFTGVLDIGAAAGTTHDPAVFHAVPDAVCLTREDGAVGNDAAANGEVSTQAAQSIVGGDSVFEAEGSEVRLDMFSNAEVAASLRSASMGTVELNGNANGRDEALKLGSSHGSGFTMGSMTDGSWSAAGGLESSGTGTGAMAAGCSDMFVQLSRNLRASAQTKDTIDENSVGKLGEDLGMMSASPNGMAVMGNRSRLPVFRNMVSGNE